MFKFAGNLAFFGLLAAAAIATTPTAAEAKGAIVINTGEDFFEAGPIPELAEHENPEFRKLQAGFKCEVMGIFWAYLHWWDCEPVLFYKQGDTYNYLNDEGAKALVLSKYSQKDMKMSFWAANGRWVFAGIVLFIFILIPILVRRGKRRAAAA